MLSNVILRNTVAACNETDIDVCIGIKLLLQVGTDLIKQLDGIFLHDIDTVDVQIKLQFVQTSYAPSFMTMCIIVNDIWFKFVLESHVVECSMESFIFM